MPTPLCCTCSLQMTCSGNDVIVIEFSDKGPYRLWYADEYSCPSCDDLIMTGWGTDAFWRPEYGRFPKDLVDQHKTANRLRYSFESPEQRSKFEAMALRGIDINFRDGLVVPDG